MLTCNVDPTLGLTNGTTGTVTGFLYGIIVQIDDEFWTKFAESNFYASLPILHRYEAMSRVVAVPPAESKNTFRLRGKAEYRTQLPLIPAFCFTMHKAQGLIKEIVLYFAGDKQFAGSLS